MGRNDRDFQVGDVLVLREYIPGKFIIGMDIPGEYTGAKAYFNVTYILDGYQWGVRPDFVVMSITPQDMAG